MKQRFFSVLLLFLSASLVMSSFSISARKLAITTQQGETGVKLNNIKDNTYSFDKMNEEEECEKKDEECLRRAVLEAHLDYIYTQHHKP